ncbi:MAG: hypothetical protein GC145_18700 [Caulobacter sp.]|nr:hypothetical protein [Caulobacter sp.]
MSGLAKQPPLAISGRGVTRLVILAGPWAIKAPRPDYGWRLFLHGLLCNMTEAVFGRSALEGFCPVVWHIPGGWLLVQRRARVMTEAEFATFDVAAFCDRETYQIAAETKADSFGWIDGQVVAIDYGEPPHRLPVGWWQGNRRLSAFREPIG